MEYTKPELVMIGQAESLVLGSSGPSHDPVTGGNHSSGASVLEFED
jgi:hypothetical protein